ncbi:MAG: hypothetical protein IJQ82_13555 [Selenomonadaceae bacterium]|nr:hypothetical protein [Selenomonadaceae bacterium]
MKRGDKLKIIATIRREHWMQRHVARTLHNSRIRRQRINRHESIGGFYRD